MWPTTACLIGSLALFTTPLLADTSLPTPFDTGYNYGLTTSCQSFFSAFLSSPSFQGCPSFGFLLTKSNQFNQMSRNTSTLLPILQSICNTSTSQCVSLMQQYASQMMESSNCQTDVNNNNTIAVSTLYDFESYQPMQSAGCLEDTDGQYCFVKTLRKASSIFFLILFCTLPVTIPGNMLGDLDPLLIKFFSCISEASQGTALYYLPAGSPLPSPSSNLTTLQCNSCNSKTLALYSNYSSMQNEPINSIWKAALSIVNATCGQSYLTASGIKFSSSPHTIQEITLPLLTLLTMFVTLAINFH
jgi:hypothetical protein